MYIFFHTGLRVSEFCGLTIKDIDLDRKILNIDHQLQRTSNMQYVIESTKTKAGTRKIPITLFLMNRSFFTRADGLCTGNMLTDPM